MRPFLPSAAASLFLGFIAFVVTLFMLALAQWALANLWLVVPALGVGAVTTLIGFFIDRYTDGDL